MARYGVFLGLGGFEYHGPKGHFGFAPRITPDDFRSAFTAAAAWGTIQQTRGADSQRNQIEVVWGSLEVRTLSFELPADTELQSTQVTLGDRDVAHQARQEGQRVTISLQDELVISEGEVIQVQMT